MKVEKKENAEIYYFTPSPHWELLKNLSSRTWEYASVIKKAFVYYKFKVFSSQIIAIFTLLAKPLLFPENAYDTDILILANLGV